MKIRNIFYPIKEWKIPSKSEKGQEWLVELYNNGELYCNCYAGQFKKACRHKREKREELEAMFGGLLEAVDYYREENKNL